jgi:hypothetical protein
LAERLDIHEVLRKVDAFDRDYFRNLSDEEQKGLSPYIMMRWLGGCKSPLQIQLVNKFMNSAVFELGDHPKLLYNLALCSTDRRPKKYSFIKTAKDKSLGKVAEVVKRYYKCSGRVAVQYLEVLDDADILQMAEELGMQDDEIKKLKLELK